MSGGGSSLAAIHRRHECLADSESSWRRWQRPTKWPEPSAKEQEGWWCGVGVLHCSGRSARMAVASLLTSLSTRDSLGVYVTERKWGGEGDNHYFCLNIGAEWGNTHNTFLWFFFFLFLWTWKRHPNTHTLTHKINQFFFFFPLFFFFLSKHEAGFLKLKVHEEIIHSFQAMAMKITISW